MQLQGKEGKLKKGGTRALFAVLLSAVLLLGYARTGYAADTFEAAVKEGFTVTVSVPEGGLDSAGVTLDFYRIADAVPYGRLDAYELVWDAKYAAQEAAWKAAVDAALEEETDLSAAAIDQIAQGLAGVVLANVPEYAPGSTAAAGTPAVAPTYTGAPGTPVTLADGETPKPGLYLIIPHGDLAAYKATVHTDAVGETPASDQITTVAEGETKLFQFAPILVTVPMREESALGTGSLKSLRDGAEIGSYVISAGNTASEEPWVNKVSVALKTGSIERFGKLKVTKTLGTFEHVSGRADEATFIFDVEVTYGENNVYSDIITMVFTEAGEQSEVIEDLPIGATAVVKEVYCGGNYKPANGAVRENITIIGDDPATDDEEMAEAAFTNTYDEKWQGSGSVVNKFDPAAGSHKEYSNGTVKDILANDITSDGGEG